MAKESRGQNLTLIARKANQQPPKQANPAAKEAKLKVKEGVLLFYVILDSEISSQEGKTETKYQ